MQGLDPFTRYLAAVDRRVTREDQQILRESASKLLVPEMRTRALRSPGKAGPLLARATVARNGKRGAVLVGPRKGTRFAWFRAFFLSGSRPHPVGGGSDARSAEVRTYHSKSAQYAKSGGMFSRRVKAREASSRRFLTNAGKFWSIGGSPFQATGPVTVPEIRANPFVEQGADAGGKALAAELARRFYGKEA